MDDQTTVVVTMVQGEDFACQAFWTDEYNVPIPISGPALLDVKDQFGQIALRFVAGADATTLPALYLNPQIGFLQLTCPSERTLELLPGSYVFDFFASVADPEQPFTRQRQQLMKGTWVVEARVSQMEEATEIFVEQGVAP